MPRFEFFLPGITDPVSETSEAWYLALPLKRHAAQSPWAITPDPGRTHGVYFQAARDFFKRDRYALLVRAVSGRLQRSVDLEEISKIQITIMKHGAFYHPALVKVVGLAEPLCFVLNTAFANTGKQILNQEFETLARLSHIRGHAGLPKVYGQASMPIQGGDRAEMFLGEWFSGFHEFHISKGAKDDDFDLLIWDDDNGHHFLTEKQSLSVYQQAACMLASYYHPETFEQIFPWHHAAGDFIVREDGAGVDVRLITVRRYAPLFDRGPNVRKKSPSFEEMMFGLLVFLLNLSIRMRIDRLDGTGDLVWAKETAVAPSWHGFLEGLRMGRFSGSLAPEALIDKFKLYLSRFPVSEVFELARTTAGGFHPEAAERELLLRHLIDHVAALWSIITED